MMDIYGSYSNRSSSDPRKELEYVVIGTLLSHAWVVAVSVAAIHIRPYLMYTRSHEKQSVQRQAHPVLRSVGGSQPVIIKH